MPFTTVKPGKDPKKILEELIATKQRIRKRNIERDFQEAVSEENVKKMFKPVTASLAEATAKATKEAVQSVISPPTQASIMPPQLASLPETEQPEGLPSPPEFLNPIVTSVYESALKDNDQETMRRRPIPEGVDTIILNRVPIKIITDDDGIERLEIRDHPESDPEFSTRLTKGLMELIVRKKHYEAASEDDEDNYTELLDKVGLLRNRYGGLQGDRSKNLKKVIKPAFNRLNHLKSPKRTSKAGTGFAGAGVTFGHVTRGRGGVH